MDEFDFEGSCTNKPGMGDSFMIVGGGFLCYAPKLMFGMQDGDKFTRLPEVYVKGNNVYFSREAVYERICPDTSHRSNTYECQMRLLI